MARDKDALRFSHHMVRCVEGYALSGLTSNGEIARILRANFDERITSADVARWRSQQPRLNKVCSITGDFANMVAASKLFEAIQDGDLTTARWWSERRNPAFMPKSKMDVTNPDTLGERLKRRAMTDDEARGKGLIYDEPGGDE